jgi:hypothetical protein
MSQLIAAVIGFAAGAFAWSGDPFMAFLVGLCALVWSAITSGRIPPWAHARNQAYVVRPE